MAGLVALTDAQAWAGTQATITQTMVDAASAMIQAWLGYQVNSQSYEKSFNGVGSTALMLPDRPLTAVASLSIDGQAIPQSAGAPAPGFAFDDKTIYLRGGYRFSRGAQNVVVSYTAGYATIPADIAQACLVLVKAVYDRAQRESDVTSMKAGDTQFVYGSASGATTSLDQLLSSDVLAALAPYRRVAPC